MAGKVVDSQAYKDEVMTTLGNHMDAVAAKLCALGCVIKDTFF